MKSVQARIYPLENGQFQVSYQNPITRKRRRNKFDSEKDAKAFKDETLRQYLIGNLNHFSEMYVGHLIERHLAERPASRLMGRKNVFKSFCAEFNAFKLNELTNAALRHWLAKLQTERNYSDRTMNVIKTQLNHFFLFLVDEGLISQSPLSKIKFRRNPPPRRGRVVLSIDEVLGLLANAKAFSPSLLFPFLSCVAHTGARRSEIVKLNREDVDFETGLLQFRETKNGRERFVAISPGLREILRERLASHGHQPVFCDEEGKRLSNRKGLPNLINKFKAYFPMDKNGWGCHSLRHSFAYNFLKRGGEMYQLQAILGHRSIDVTVDLYGQLQAQDIKCPSPYEESFGEK